MLTFSQGRQNIDLQVRCNTGKPQVVLGLTEQKFTEASKRWFILRVDEDRPTLGYGQAGVGTNKIAFRLTKHTYVRMSRAKKLVFRVYRDADYATDIIFTPKQTAEAFARLAKFCPTSSGYDQEPLYFDPAKKLPPFPEDGQAARYLE